MEALLAEHGQDLRLAAFYTHEHAERLEHADGAVSQCLHRLTGRERECLLWLSRGLRTVAIADRLGIAPATVDLHFKGARRKLRAATREEALAKAILADLIDP
jgi:DNA-binding CsgD family transcriptional regulator